MTSMLSGYSFYFGNFAGLFSYFAGYFGLPKIKYKSWTGQMKTEEISL